MEWGEGRESEAQVNIAQLTCTPRCYFIDCVLSLTFRCQFTLIFKKGSLIMQSDQMDERNDAESLY